MDAETFNMVDGIISNNRDTDGRPNAEVLLEFAVQKEKLQEYVRIIATRYCLRPQAVIGWYVETLNRRVKETTQLIQKITQMRKVDG